VSRTSGRAISHQLPWQAVKTRAVWSALTDSRQAPSAAQHMSITGPLCPPRTGRGTQPPASRP